MVKAAYLRVYVPPEVIGEWSRHVEGIRPPRVITIGEYGVWHESLRDDAFEADWNGRRWICPRYPRLRMLEGLLAFRNAYPGMTGSLLAPEPVVVRAAADLEGYYDRHPRARSHILTSSWHVPLRWFAAFEPGQREVVEAKDGKRRIRYRTSLPSAKERLDSAIAVLDDVGFEDGVVDQVRELLTWLEGFPEDALLELDYGTVAELFSEGQLVMDESASDVEASLAALELGDFEEAGRRYASAAGRWAGAQSLMYAN